MRTSLLSKSMPALPVATDGRTGVMICGHGSRDKAAVEEFAGLARIIRDRLDPIPVDYGYLEFARPMIRDGLDRLREAGAREILAVPGMLFAAGHAKNDIPSTLNAYAARHRDASIRYGRELGINPRMLAAAADRIGEAIEPLAPIHRHDTILVVVGRGASDPDANSNVAKVMRMLWEGMGFGWGETAYSGVTFPLVGPALERAAMLGFRRIVVFPYFLFTGILVERIYAAVDEAQAAFRDIEFVKARWLGSHPKVVDTFVARLREIVEGTGVMNCQMCKYREQVIGFETEVGLKQESHHLHVEGIAVADGHNHHAHGDGHHHHSRDSDHGHHHPYPHADHPLGPVTLKRPRQG